MNATSSAATKRVRILVVEDDAATSQALEQLLRYYQYETIMVRTVAEALRHLPDQPGRSPPEPEVILLDLMLPDGDGTEVLQAVRDRRLRSRVAVVTGAGDPERLERVRNLQPEALLYKPVDFLQILEKLPRVA